VNVNPVRKGVSGWKLTKKMPSSGGPPPSNEIINPNRGQNASGLSMQVWPGMNHGSDSNAQSGNRMMEAFSGMGNPTPTGAQYRQSHMTAHLGNDHQHPHIY